MCRASVTTQTPADNKKNRLKSLLSRDGRQQSRLQHARYWKFCRRDIFCRDALPSGKERLVLGLRAALFGVRKVSCATQSTCWTFAVKYLKTNLRGKSREMPRVTPNISVAGVTQSVLHSGICGRHCCGVTLATPKCFLLPNIEVTRIHARWTKPRTLTVWRVNTENGPRGQCSQMSAFLLTHLVRVHEGAHAEAHAAQQLTHPAEMMTERELITWFPFYRKTERLSLNKHIFSIFM